MPELERFLVIQLGSLADLVHTTPVCHALRESRPNALIAVLVRKEWETTLSGHPWVDKVIAYDQRGAHRGLLGFNRLLRLIRQEPYDGAVDLTANAASRLVMRASGAVTKSRSRASSVVSSALRTTRLARCFARRTAVEEHLHGLRSLGIEGAYRSPRLFPRAEWISAAKNLLRQLGAKSSVLVGIAPGSEGAAAMWPAERYGELAKRLSCAGSDVAVIGWADEKELCAKVAAGRAGVFDLAGRLALGETLGMLSQCTACVGNDSGLTHCAHALGIPTIALFGPTDGRRFVWGGGQAIQRTVPCGPCAVGVANRCPTRDHACLLGISVDEVLLATIRLLPAPKEPEAEALHW